MGYTLQEVSFFYPCEKGAPKGTPLFLVHSNENLSLCLFFVLIVNNPALEILAYYEMIA